MRGSKTSSVLEALHAVAAQHRELTLLVLFGSRARGEGSPNADWDFGFLANGPLDSLQLMAALAEVVGSERLDLVNLARASGLLRYRTARDGMVVYEAQAGIFDRFRFEAARFWCDAEPVLRLEYDTILDRLG